MKFIHDKENTSAKEEIITLYMRIYLYIKNFLCRTNETFPAHRRNKIKNK